MIVSGCYCDFAAAAALEYPRRRRIAGVSGVTYARAHTHTHTPTPIHHHTHTHSHARTHISDILSRSQDPGDTGCPRGEENH